MANHCCEKPLRRWLSRLWSKWNYWVSFRVYTFRTSKAFFVDKDEIVKNDYDLSLNRYKEIVYVPIEYDPPLEIIRQLKEMETKIMSDLDELEKMLIDYNKDK